MTDRLIYLHALTNAPANCLRASKADDTRLRVITFACWGFRCSVNSINVVMGYLMRGHRSTAVLRTSVELKAVSVSHKAQISKHY